MANAQPWINPGTDCCSPFSTCCLTFWCPCITYSRVYHRVRKDPNLNGFSACNGSCCGYAALMYCGFAWVMQMMQRGELRQRYNLDGNGCTDCLCACCCTCCDLIQQDKESKDREAERGMIQQQPGLQQTGMVYQPQAAHIPQEQGLYAGGAPVAPPVVGGKPQPNF